MHDKNLDGCWITYCIESTLFVTIFENFQWNIDFIAEQPRHLSGLRTTFLIKFLLDHLDPCTVCHHDASCNQDTNHKCVCDDPFVGNGIVCGGMVQCIWYIDFIMKRPRHLVFPLHCVQNYSWIFEILAQIATIMPSVITVPIILAFVMRDLSGVGSYVKIGCKKVKITLLLELPRYFIFFWNFLSTWYSKQKRHHLLEQILCRN